MFIKYCAIMKIYKTGPSPTNSLLYRICRIGLENKIPGTKKIIEERHTFLNNRSIACSFLPVRDSPKL